MKLDRIVTVVATALFAGMVVAQTAMPQAPRQVPEGVAPRHLHVTVGPDGIGRIDTGSDVTTQQLPPLPVYSAMETSWYVIGHQYPGDPDPETLLDSVPLAAPAVINQFTFWYYDWVGIPGDTFDLDVSFYDGTWQPDPWPGGPPTGGPGTFQDYQDIFDNGCGGFYYARNRLPIVVVTLLDLPQDNTYSWIVDVDLGANMFVAPGRLVYEYFDYGHTHVPTGGEKVGDTTYLTANGDNYGIPMGQSVGFDYAQYEKPTGTGHGLYGSPTDSNHTWWSWRYNDVDNFPCWWWGGWYNFGNMVIELRGVYGMVGELAGDYGAGGNPDGTLPDTNRSLWIAIRDGDAVTYEMVQCFADPAEGINRYFMLPFGDWATGPYDITVLAFNGYVAKKVTGVTPDAIGFSTHVVFELKRGDGNYDNTINLTDINSALINFGIDGDVP